VNIESFGVKHQHGTSAMPGRDGSIQLRQLQAWQHYSNYWLVTPEYRETEENHIAGPHIPQIHLVCAGMRNHELETGPFGPCGKSVVLVIDGSVSNVLYPSEFLSLVTAHIRQFHRDIEDVVYSGTGL